MPKKIILLLIYIFFLITSLILTKDVKGDGQDVRKESILKEKSFFEKSKFSSEQQNLKKNKQGGRKDPPEPPTDDGDPVGPIDGGFGILLAGFIAYITKKIYKHKKQTS